MEEEYNSAAAAAATLRSAPTFVAHGKPSGQQQQQQQITTDHHFYHSVPNKQSPSLDIANNNNNNNISYKDQPLIGSPHLSSSSSVASSHDHQRNNNEDDQLDNLSHHQPNQSPPSSPQSSYNSSFGSNSGRKLINNSSTSITSLVPGGVVTTQNISTVIKPKSNSNSLQFVKIQTPELSKKAVEQIRVAEESKISRDKIKEVEEEWQNNLLNWKSKRRQQFTHSVTDHDPNNSPFESNDNLGARKIKTFAEMIEERAKSGNRLGFHLQRYIGAADGDDEEEEHPIAIGDGLHEPKQFEQTETESTEPKNDKIDSDCEANSSTTSSGYNQPNSKSPDDLNLVDSPKVRSPVNGQHLIEDEYNDPHRIIRCDKNSSHDIVDNSHSISVLDNADLDPFNSTLKQGVKMPQSNSINAGKEGATTKSADKRLNGDIVAAPRATRNEKVIDNNSIFEEDEEDDQDEDDPEEEEEQKHLQRIAFEAKLKAFEKLTKPTIETPKFVPKRIVKPPIFNQLSATKQADGKLPKPAPKLAPKPSYVPPAPPSNNSSRQVSITSVLQPSPTPPAPPSPPISASIPSPPPLTSVPKVTTKPIASPASYSPPLPAVSTSVNKPTPPAPVTPIVNNLLPPPASPSPEPMTKTNISNRSSSPVIVPPVVQQKHNLPQSQHMLVTASKPTPPSQRAPIATPKVAHQAPQGSAITPSSRKCSREDKDKTILSVSGKKRCSSCKEELGRGAAAFVVESLSLVYHTNCFRCSVCHINLSNGFRGVDVRVHAGALHCQNCYSKDGLNYSRV